MNLIWASIQYINDNNREKKIFIFIFTGLVHTNQQNKTSFFFTYYFFFQLSLYHTCFFRASNLPPTSLQYHWRYYLRKCNDFSIFTVIKWLWQTLIRKQRLIDLNSSSFFSWYEASNRAIMCDVFITRPYYKML